MINRYALLLSAPAVLLTSGIAAGAGTPLLKSLNISHVPPATVGGESHKANSYFGYPDLDTAQVVTAGIDRGADFSGPTDYPQERHSVFSEAADTYFAFYEYNAAGGFDIGAKFWQTVGPIGFWSIESTPSDNASAGLTDAGRPSGHDYSSGLMVAFHATSNGSEYDTHVNTYDWATQSWGEATRLFPEDGTSNTFPFLDQSSDGTWFVVQQRGEGIVDIVVALSDDGGASWTESTAYSGASDNWLLPSGAADPSNGDIYVAYNDDADANGTGDVVIQRTTDGGTTWSAPQVIDNGVAGGQKVEPSVVIDSDHNVHVVYQGNVAAGFDGGLSGFPQTGPTGVPYYAWGSFDDSNTWVAGGMGPLNSRERLADMDSACGIPVDINQLSTDSLSGMPQMGIHYGEGGDVLYAAYSQPFYAASTPEGQLVCDAWDVFMQSNHLNSGEGWGDRTMISSISDEQSIEDRNAIYVHMTHDVPISGPGVVWSEMYGALQPAEAMFNRPTEVEVGIGGDVPSPGIITRAVLNQNAPNPFNPSTSISYELAEAGPVELAVFDVTGRKVRTLVNESQTAGSHAVRWEGMNDQNEGVSSGVYFYRLTATNETLTRSMLIVK